VTLTSPPEIDLGEGDDPNDVTSRPPVPEPRRRVVQRVAMRGRKWVVKLHRWLSFALLAWLVVVSFTGAWLVESHAIDGWLNPGRYDTTAGDVGPDAAVESALAAGPDDAVVSYVTMPGNSRGVYTVDLEEPKPPLASGVEQEPAYVTYYIDPGSGTVNDRADYEEGLTWWLYRGHMYLWQDNGVFGVFDPESGWCKLDADGHEPGGVRGVVCDVIPAGDDMVAWLALAWMVVLLTGFYLWYWPGVKRWATALVIKRGRGAFTFNMSVHKVVGLVVWVPLMAITFTGIAFAFPKMDEWFEAATPAKADFFLWEFPEDMVSTPAEDAEPVGVEAAIRSIDAKYPEVQVEGISPPWDETAYYATWVTRGFSPWTRQGSAGNVYVAVDQYSGEVIRQSTPEEGNMFDQAWDDYSFPLHSGDVVGPSGRVVWVLVGLSPLVLGTTGVTMNVIRRRKRRKRQARGTDEAGLEVATVV
jgi:uncharacterized iron-regulated membrane protein